MRAQEFESLKHAGEIEEARMGASDFDAAVAQGTTKGVLVGYEFEVLVPQATITQSIQSAQQAITAEAVQDIISKSDFFDQTDLFETTPQVFDSLFKLKPGIQANYATAEEAFVNYQQKLLEIVKGYFYKIPEAVRLRYIPQIKNDMRRVRVDGFQKQMAFARRLGERLYYDQRGKLEELGRDLGRAALQTSYAALFREWLGFGSQTVAVRLTDLFDFNPAEVYTKLKLKDYEDYDVDDDYQEYDYSGAAKVLKPAVAQTFNRPVNVFQGYHQQKKNLTDWYIEPDGSLTPTNGGDGAAEIVSPPMAAAESMLVLKNFYTMAQQLGLYTNSTTGLHINVSIPDQVDVLKLALFLGDQYVLQQFGRQDSDYAKSSQKSIERDAPGQINKKGRIDLKKLQKLAKDATGFHTASISDSGKYISFRHAGGNYLADYAKIATTVGRFIRAMLIASDPNAYAKEYQTKLAKITSKPTRTIQDISMNLRTNGVPVYTVSIWKTTRNSWKSLLQGLSFGWTKSVWGMYSIQDIQENSEQAKQNIVNNLRSPELKTKAQQTDAASFALITIIPTEKESIEEINASLDRGVQTSYPNGYNRAGYGLIRKQSYPPNHPVTMSVLKTILKQRLRKI